MQENKTVTPVKRNYAAKRRTKRAIALAGLAVFMALTIGLTWTYWRAGVTAPDADTSNQRFTIHTGSEFRTRISMEDEAFSPDGPLMPYDIWRFGFPHERVIDGGPDAVGEISKTLEVLWAPYSDAYHIPAGTTGTLTIGVADWTAVDATSGVTNLDAELANAFRFRSGGIGRDDPLKQDFDGANAYEGSTVSRYHNLGYYNTQEDYNLGSVNLFEVSFVVIEGQYTPNTSSPGDPGDWDPGDPVTDRVEPVVATNGRHFVIDIDVVYFVTMTIRMNIPNNSTVYDVVAGMDVGFQLALNVINPTLPA